MSRSTPIVFDTPGRIAAKLGVPLHRVDYVLRSRPYIVPSARVGRLRVFDAEGVACIRFELAAIHARTSGASP